MYKEMILHHTIQFFIGHNYLLMYLVSLVIHVAYIEKEAGFVYSNPGHFRLQAKYTEKDLTVLLNCIFRNYHTLNVVQCSRDGVKLSPRKTGFNQ